MSTQELDPSLRPKHYAPGTGADRYARFAEAWMDITRTDVFDQIAEALEQNKQTVVVGGNGLGKSYAAAILGISALYTNPHTVVPITAGNGDTLKNSIWKPIKGNWKRSGLPGSYKDNDRSLHTELDPEWFLECHSPKYPEDLEGDHNANVVYIIEEAEKPGVTKEHIDSARSTLGDNDHILVLANPPTDEANIVHSLVQSDSWDVLRFPTWESRNAKVDRGLTDEPKVDGLSGVGKLKDDWGEYHDEPWPGVERVIEISSPFLDADGMPTVREWEGVEENPEFREDLHERWYKRRAGIMPPDGTQKWRPFGVADVEQAFRREYSNVSQTPTHCGIDVARSGGDLTVMIGLHDDTAKVEYKETGDNHHSQRLELQDLLQGWPQPEVNVDAVGEGSGLADELDARVPNIMRFGNGETASNDDYRHTWDEGLQLIGEWLRGSGSFSDSELYEELKIAARVVEFSEKTLRSRGKVIEATPKETIKAELGRSPDRLDALLMALHAKHAQTAEQNVPLSW